MAVKIRLKRMGKIRAPFYRVVVMDSRTKRDGRAIEEIGKYHPTEEPSLIDIDLDRANYWLSNGAQPTEAVAALARGVYDDRAFDRLPVLADALDDAGCANADLLAHLRGPGPHVRGCWAVDLLLGKG